MWMRLCLQREQFISDKQNVKERKHYILYFQKKLESSGKRETLH